MRRMPKAPVAPAPKYSLTRLGSAQCLRIEKKRESAKGIVGDMDVALGVLVFLAEQLPGTHGNVVEVDDAHTPISKVPAGDLLVAEQGNIVMQLVGDDLCVESIDRIVRSFEDLEKSFVGEDEETRDVLLGIISSALFCE